MSDDEQSHRPDRVQHKTLAQAIHGVMCDVGYVFKSGKVDIGGSYSYASDADMIRTVRPVMLRHGLVLTPTHMTHETIQVDKAKGNGHEYLSHVLGTYELIHVDSEQRLTIQMPGSGMDSREKGVYKALTGAYKYVLREIFILETGDDPEGDQAQRQGGDPSPELVNELTQLGRTYAIRCMYQRAREDYSGQALAAELKRRKLHSLSDLKHFTIWLGMGKLAQLSDNQINKLLDRLETDAGRKTWNKFVNDCGVAGE